MLQLYSSCTSQLFDIFVPITCAETLLFDVITFIVRQAGERLLTWTRDLMFILCVTHANLVQTRLLLMAPLWRRRLSQTPARRCPNFCCWALERSARAVRSWPVRRSVSVPANFLGAFISVISHQRAHDIVVCWKPLHDSTIIMLSCFARPYLMHLIRLTNARLKRAPTCRHIHWLNFGHHLKSRQFRQKTWYWEFAVPAWVYCKSARRKLSIQHQKNVQHTLLERLPPPHLQTARTGRFVVAR